MPEGIVKFFDTIKGYGFIVPDGMKPGEGDIFFHARFIERSGRDPSKFTTGTKVKYETHPSPKSVGKLEACSISIFEPAIKPKISGDLITTVGPVLFGTVRFVSGKNDYAFIEPDTSTYGDVFVHITELKKSDIEGGFVIGMRLSFNLTHIGIRVTATRVSLIKDYKSL